eukprot:GHUV01009969.1.p1 GENE.GHUV01009969.1~~GHUV01009969.1.p1  ORF type:complete len:543 (+),score=153.99 GHUV01009969.1:403-2031(+)
MTANLVPIGQFQQLKAQLEDTQESLGAALARIEVFRLREKALTAEIAKLRLGEPVDDASSATVHATPATTAQQQPGTTGQASSQPTAAETAEQHETEQQPKWPIPCYVTEIGDNLPVMLIGAAGRKTPGSVVITKDYVDFVEVRARVKRHEFMGFAAAPTAYVKRSQLMPSCLSPDTSSPTHSVSRAASAGAHHGRHISLSDGGISSTSPASAAVTGVELSRMSGGYGSPLRPQSPTHSPKAGSLSPRSGSGSPARRLKHSVSVPQPDAAPWHPLHDAALAASGETTGAWQMLWRSGGMQQRLTFEATLETREVLHKHTAKWLDNGSEDEQQPEVAAAAAPEGTVELAVPKHLLPGSYTPRLSEPSSILSSSRDSSTDSSSLVVGTRHIAAALPARYQTRDWNLLYSTARHGISLQTLYRKAAGSPATVLVVRDTGGYVFGAFCTEPWKPSPRFFGTGETLVFQLEPHKVMFPWKVKSALKNDFFMYAQQDSLGVGGLGAFAIWLDAELLQGSSGSCGTFGSPCLASREEFKVAAVELWALV